PSSPAAPDCTTVGVTSGCDRTTVEAASSSRAACTSGREMVLLESLSSTLDDYYDLLLHANSHIRRESRPQSETGGRVHPGDANRHPLHHLDEVARGVVRGQQREARTGSAGEALHLAFELPAGVRVDRDLHRLPRLHRADLRLLEVRHQVGV